MAIECPICRRLITTPRCRSDKGKLARLKRHIENNHPKTFLVANVEEA